MAKITIDESACVGCGLCVNACPDCFELSDDGIAKVIQNDGCSCDAQDIASQCPVNAISVE